MTSDDEAPSERWRRVERVYLSALGRNDVERSALLDDLCGGDETLRRDVESLLRVQPEAQSFLATGAMAVAAEIMRGEVGTDLVGQTLDGYTITGRLGAGGMGVNIREGTTFETAPPKRLFHLPEQTTGNRASYSVSKDGQRFLVLAPGAGTIPAPLTVRLNWTTRLAKQSASDAQ